ncbi:MAG: hypothetical protein KCHDKBKB_02020 [Elusimicrobia bacterium]|nr:hypothetical protein [Elusimicrobiota bacterium]
MVKVDMVKVEVPWKYIVAEEPSAAVFTNSCGVVNELTNVKPLELVFEETTVSTETPRRLILWPAAPEKLIVPLPGTQMTPRSSWMISKSF